MGRRVNDGDFSGIKQDKFRNSRFEHEQRGEPSYYYGGASRKSANTIGGPYQENRGRKSADSLRSQWSGSPFENGKVYNWYRRQGWDEYYERPYDRGNRNYGGGQLDHEGGHVGKGPRGYKRPDKSIYEDVCDTLYLHPDIDASNIVVSVNDGIVFLKGSVRDRRSKKMAEISIENVSGVNDVQNQLTFRQSKEELH